MLFIAINFDGTCVTHEYPEIGKDIGAVPVLKQLVEKNHKLILFTMRCDTFKRKYLTEAINWFKKNDIMLSGIQSNPEQKYWTDSPKAYAHLYIDDSALGCPLIYPAEKTNYPYVDWEEVEYILKDRNII